MTVATQQRRVQYALNGTTTAFPVPFPFPAAADLVVTRTLANGSDIVLALNVDYTVTGGAGSGTVTYPAAGASGERLTIKRQIARTQDTDYVPNDPFPADAHEDALDKLTMIAQEDGDELERAIRVPDTDAQRGAMILPPAEQRAGKFMAFDGAGKVVPSSGTGADAGLRDDLAEATGATLVGATDGLTVQGHITQLHQFVNGLSAAVLGSTPPRIFVDEDPPAAYDRIVALTLLGADFEESYYVANFFRDDLSGGRFNFIIKRASDDVSVLGISLSGAAVNPAGFESLLFFDLVPLGGSGMGGVVGVDFGDGTPRWAITGTESDSLLVDSLTYFDNPLFAQAVEDQVLPLIEAEAVLAGDFFERTATDRYAKALIKGGVVGGGDPDDTYWINYETIYFPGVPLWRARFRIHSERYGQEVGRTAIGFATDPTGSLPESLYLTLRADGQLPDNTLPGNEDWPDYDPGITAMIDLDWTAVDWTMALTAYTDGAATGIRPERVVTAEEMMNAWLSDEGPRWHKRITVGAAGDFTTVVAAMQHIANPTAAGTAQLNRTTYPHSRFCSPERPVLVEVIDAGHTEEITSYSYLGLDQSNLLIPHGCILRLRPDTVIWMERPPGNTAPLAEASYTCRIEGGGQLDQRGEGYVLHIDNFGGLSNPGGASPDLVRRPLVFVCKDVQLRYRQDRVTPNIGGGTADGSYYLFDGVRALRDANTSGTDPYFFHNTPNETVPCTLHFRRCTHDQVEAGSIAALKVSKSAASSIRHKLNVEDCDFANIEVDNSAGGGAGFRRVGKLSGATVSGTLDP